MGTHRALEDWRMPILFNRAQAASVGAEAARAARRGRTVFAAMFNAPFTASGSVAGWAEQIEAVEAEGWMLSDFSAVLDDTGRPRAYCVFRRTL